MSDFGIILLIVIVLMWPALQLSKKRHYIRPMKNQAIMTQNPNRPTHSSAVSKVKNISSTSLDNDASRRISENEPKMNMSSKIYDDEELECRPSSVSANHYPTSSGGWRQAMLLREILNRPKGW